MPNVSSRWLKRLRFLLAEKSSRPAFGRRCLRFETLEERVNPAKVVSVTTSGPAITAGAGDLRAGQPVVFTVNFDSAVTVGANGFPTLSLSDGATAAYAGGSGSTALKFDYTVAVRQNSADLTVSAFNLNGSTIQDSGGVSATLSGAVTNPAGTLQIDTTSPFITDLEFASANQQTDGTLLVTYTISFSEQVNGVSPSAFSVATTGTAAGFIKSVTPLFGNSYSVTIDGTGIGNGGAVRLEVNNGSISDSAGNPSDVYSFTPAGPAQQILASNNTYSVAVADVNGDGIPDIIAPSESSNSVAVLLNNSTGSFTPAPGSPFSVPSPNFAVVQDINGDGIPDIVVSAGSSDSVSVLLGTGGGSFGVADTFAVSPTGEEAYGIQVADLNGDGIPDLVVANGTANTVSVMLGTGTGTFIQAPGSPIAVGTDPQSVAIGDVNSDRIPDLAVADTGSNDITVLLGKGGGSFSPAANSPIAVGHAPSSVTLADLNRDKNLDLVVANSGDATVSTLYGSGTGSFTAQDNSTFSVGADPRAVVAMEIGNLLVPVSANAGSNNVTINTGSFGVSNLTVNGSPADVAVADVNGDGRLDIVTSDFGGGGVELLLAGPPALEEGDPYGLRPVITNVVSSGVPGTVITITGSNFNQFSAVQVGDYYATVLSVAPDGTEMTAVVPPKVGSNHGLVVITGPQSSNTWSFNYAAPILSSISPAFGSSAGSTTITLTGSLFDLFPSNNTVLIGGKAATKLQYAVNGTQTDYTRLIATVPAGTGEQNVTVIDGGQTSNALVFNYDPTSSQTVYVNSAWSGLPAGTVISSADPNFTGTQSATIGTTGFATLQGGIDATLGTVDVLPGSYPDPAIFDHTLTLQVTQGTVTIAGNLAGTTGLAKAGSGTLVLTGNDTDAGATVSAGSLLIDGTMTASAATSVLSGATLGGAGTLAGTVTASGIVAPGNAAGTVGTLTTGALTLGTASSGAGILSLDLTSATSYDRVALSSLNLTFATLSISAGSALATGDQFTIVSVAGTSGGVTGTFDGLTEGGTFPVGSRVFRINYAAGDGNDVVLTDVTPVSIAGSPTMNGGLSQVNSTLAANQHSMVGNVVYSFSQAVSLSAANFTLSGINGTTVAPNVNVSSNAGGTVWTVTFSGVGVNAATHSIGDGEYSLVLSGVPGLASNTYDFFRLLGDMDGSGTVDTTDFTTFISTFQRAPGDPFYLGADDFDNSGTIDSTDFTQFTDNLLKSVPSPLPN